MLVASRRRVLFITLSLAALAIYVPRTYRALALIGDSAELVSAAATWGVPHPPGYPLYTLLTHAMTRLSVLELPFRVHVTSACFHAAAVGVVGCIIELVTGSLTAAWLGAAALALGRIFFLGSLYAEVFPLNDLLSACALLFAVRIARAEKDEQGATLRWATLAAVLGLSLAHHHMIVLLFPAVVVLVGPSLRRWAREHSGAMIAIVPGAVALTAIFYALIPIAASRDPLPSWGDVRDLDSLVRLMTRQDYGGPLHASRRLAQGQLLERLDALVVGTAGSFGAAGVVLFLIGTLGGLRRDTRTSVALLVAVLGSGPLFAAMNSFDIHSDYRIAFFERFTTMSHVPFAVSIGVGAAMIEAWLGGHPRLPARASRAVTSLLAVVAIAPLLGNLRELDFRGDRWSAAYAHDLVESTPDGALVLLKSDMASQAALYGCAVERRCGDRIVLTPGQLWMPWKQRELHRRYPALSLPPAGVSSPARWLVGQNLSARPVFVHPELVDDVVHGELATLPSLLLFRVYPSEPALRADLPQFHEEIVAITQRRRCEGCSLVISPAPLSPIDVELAHLYDGALHAHAAAATELGLGADASALAAWSVSP